MNFHTQNNAQNIFDMASSQSRPKKNEETQTVFLQKVQPEVIARESALEKELSQEDIMEHWERCKAMYQELDRQIDALFANTSLTPSQLSHFLSDKNKFTPEQWQALEQVKKQNTEKFLSLCRQLPVDGETVAQKYVQLIAGSTKKAAPRDKKSSLSVKKAGGESAGKRPLPRHKWLEMH